MTSEQFREKFEQGAAAIRRALWLGFVGVAIVEVPLVAYVFSKGRERPASLLFLCVSATICYVAIAAWILAVKFTMRRVLPACTSCSKLPNARQFRQIVATGQCPHCHIQLFNPA